MRWRHAGCGACAAIPFTPALTLDTLKLSNIIERVVHAQLILADPSMLLKGRASTPGFGAMDRGEEVEQEQAAKVKRRGAKKASRGGSPPSTASSGDADGSPLSSMGSVMGSMDDMPLSIEEVLGLEAAGGDRRRSRKGKSSEKKEASSSPPTVAAPGGTAGGGGRYLKK